MYDKELSFINSFKSTIEKICHIFYIIPKQSGRSLLPRHSSVTHILIDKNPSKSAVIVFILLLSVDYDELFLHIMKN